MLIDITIAIPVFNGIKTLPVVLDSLANPKYTGLKNIDVLCIDNGSQDGSAEFLDVVIRNKWYHHLNIIKKSEPQKPGGVTANIPVMRKKLADNVDTKYIMYLNHDIYLAPFAIKDLYEDFISRTDCGALAIQYDPLTTHIESGCTIMETMIARKVKWGYSDNKCDCWFLKESLNEIGLSMEYQEGARARDIIFR